MLFFSCSGLRCIKGLNLANSFYKIRNSWGAIFGEIFNKSRTDDGTFGIGRSLLKVSALLIPKPTI